MWTLSVLLTYLECIIQEYNPSWNIAQICEASVDFVFNLQCPDLYFEGSYMITFFNKVWVYLINLWEISYSHIPLRYKAAYINI